MFVSGRGMLSGGHRGVFSANGKTLYTGHTVRGWGKPAEGLQRITWLGKTPFDVKSIKLTKSGFVLKFTSPHAYSDFGDAKIKVQSFWYEDKWSYGGPQKDKREEKWSSIKRISDSQIAITFEKLAPGRVYQLDISKLKGKDGSDLMNKTYYYTLNQLVK